MLSLAFGERAFRSELSLAFGEQAFRSELSLAFGERVTFSWVAKRK
jgi:hypothetical protein